jgi:hypothetical protein
MQMMIKGRGFEKSHCEKGENFYYYWLTSFLLRPTEQMARADQRPNHQTFLSIVNERLHGLYKTIQLNLVPFTETEARRSRLRRCKEAQDNRRLVCRTFADLHAISCHV